MPNDNTSRAALAALVPDPDRLLTENQVRDRYGLKVATLRAWRVRGTVKLPFIKLGAAVRYRVRDLEAFLADNQHFHTSEIEGASE